MTKLDESLEAYDAAPAERRFKEEYELRAMTDAELRQLGANRSFADKSESDLDKQLALKQRTLQQVVTSSYASGRSMLGAPDPASKLLASGNALLAEKEWRRRHPKQASPPAPSAPAPADTNGDNLGWCHRVRACTARCSRIAQYTVATG